MKNLKNIDGGVAPQQFKDVAAHFATGVTLVTTVNQEGHPAGLLVSSLSSVSLEPPLVLFCLAKKSQLHDVFANQDRFAVNILNTRQDTVVQHFTTPMNDRWAGIPYSTDLGLPILDKSLATIECDVAARHEAGDHTIYIGHVKKMTQGAGDPLLYYNRQFGKFNSDQS
jgi:flavin reductase (DIM6/NTAB) family NADH-FMN oxidoreductase RutF